MDRNDQQAIDGMFDKLAEVGRQAPPRDADAERYISDRFARTPGAAYFMAQTVVMQDHALNAAQRTIEELQARVDGLEQRAAPAEAGPSSGGFLSGSFGDGAPGRRPSGAVPRVGQARPVTLSASPWGAPAASGMAPSQPDAAMPPQRPGGGFLAGAAQTAMGVAGGVLLGNVIGGMFGGHAAQAAEAPKTAEPQPAESRQDDAQTDAARDDAPRDDTRGQEDANDADPGVQDASYDDAGGYDGGFGDDLDI